MTVLTASDDRQNQILELVIPGYTYDHTRWSWHVWSHFIEEETEAKTERVI